MFLKSKLTTSGYSKRCLLGLDKKNKSLVASLLQCLEIYSLLYIYCTSLFSTSLLFIFNFESSLRLRGCIGSILHRLFFKFIGEDSNLERFKSACFEEKAGLIKVLRSMAIDIKFMLSFGQCHL